MASYNDRYKNLPYMHNHIIIVIIVVVRVIIIIIIIIIRFAHYLSSQQPTVFFLEISATYRLVVC